MLFPFENSKIEHEQGYVRFSKTESSFNSTVKDIFNSSLNNKYAFVETLKDEIPTKLKDNKIHFFDKVRCRKTVMYHNEYEYPLFTVIDEPIIYRGIKVKKNIKSRNKDQFLKWECLNTFN